MNSWIGPALLMAVLVADVLWVVIGCYRDHHRPVRDRAFNAIWLQTAIQDLEHKVWPDQTADWFGHESCNRCNGGHTHSISTKPSPGFTLSEIQRCYPNHDHIEVTALGQVEPRYVPGRPINPPRSTLPDPGLRR
jgi:hypothetical protein